jgi:excisionase family DNA binding protein
MITKRELADRLRVSPWKVEQLVRAGAIPAIRLTPVTVRYHLEDLKAYVAANKATPDPNAYGENSDADIESEIRRALGTRYPEGTQLLTTAEAAEWLGLSVWSIAAWARRGWLPRVTLRPGSSVRFDAWDVQEVIERRRPQRRGAWHEMPLEPKAVTKGSDLKLPVGV